MLNRRGTSAKQAMVVAFTSVSSSVLMVRAGASSGGSKNETRLRARGLAVINGIGAEL
jgi:hypothetical protein